MHFTNKVYYIDVKYTCYSNSLYLLGAKQLFVFLKVVANYLNTAA